jgi:hypothetical protein
VTPKHAGGRPNQIDREELFQKRDSLIHALSFGWEIGWELKCARTPEQLRHAFRQIADGANEQLLGPFVRVSTIEAAAKDIRSTQAAKTAPAKRMYEILSPLQNSTRNLQSIRAGIEADLERPPAPPDLMKEYFHRLPRHRELENEMNHLRETLKRLEDRLADQEASFAQNELLSFIRYDKYAHTPRNLAQAMAGLPKIGCWHSFQLCEKFPSPFWPKGEREKWPLHYRIFEVIEECWNLQQRDHSQELPDLLLSRIQAIPRSEFLGQYLRKNWRFLRQAVNETPLAKLPSQAVPYRVLGKLKEIIGTRAGNEQSLAEREEREAFGDNATT